jgi:hypothetical protein
MRWQSKHFINIWRFEVQIPNKGTNLLVRTNREKVTHLKNNHSRSQRHSAKQESPVISYQQASYIHVKQHHPQFPKVFLLTHVITVHIGQAILF